MSKPCDACEAGFAGGCAVRAENQPTQTEFSADGLWMNLAVIPDKGSLLPQHAHAFPHQTVLIEGGVIVYKGSETAVEHWAPKVISIPAQVPHYFLTLSENVKLLCVHRFDGPGRPEIVSENHLVD